MITIDDFNITNIVLGKGMFGKVYKGYFTRRPHIQVAVKIIKLNSEITEEDKLRLRRETQILLNKNIQNNKNIVKLYSVVEK